MKFSTLVPELDLSLAPALQHKIDFKTKPLGSLGQLEALALQVGLIQNTLSPQLLHPSMIVFAGDHGMTRTPGISAFPREVTPQMVLNFVQGGAAINAFCRQHQMDLQVVDAGVDFDFDPELPIVHAKIAHGTKDLQVEDAMSAEELDLSLSKGAELVLLQKAKGSNVIGFGEMGIGNSGSAALIYSQLLGLSLEQVTGRGTGVQDLDQKIHLLSQAQSRLPKKQSAAECLAAVGGFEIAQMCGAMIEAARQGFLILVDGFICTAAFVAAVQMAPAVKDFAVLCHRSAEPGHKLAAEALGMKPLLDLGLRLGEGTGAALSYPLILSALAFLNEMASFESAGVATSTH